MRLRFTGPDGRPAFKFGPDGNFSWMTVKRLLEESGFSIVSEGFGAQIDALVAFNHSTDALAEAKESGIARSRRILLLWESPPVWPSQYSRAVYQQYGLVLSPSPVRAYRTGVEESDYFAHPSDINDASLPSYAEFERRPNTACIVQANKHSAVRGEFYTLRRRTIAEFQSQGIPISVYGTAWNQGFRKDLRQAMGAASIATRAHSIPQLRSMRNLGLAVIDHRGEVPDKDRALSNHRISIVIENCDDYVSEKPIDAIRNCTIALYVGPSMRSMHLPDDLVRQAEPHPRAIAALAESLLKLPTTEQFSIVQSQFESLRIAGDSIERETSLASLARKINRQLLSR